MSSLPDISIEAGDAAAWSIEDAAKLYRVADWGAPYYHINELGNAALSALDKDGTAIDISAVVAELRKRGVQFPILIRFQDVLGAQVSRINEAFAAAIGESGYPNEYRGVYPIKVNQLHEVVDELLDAGRQFGMGLECGSKAELMAALPQVDGDMLLVCNGVKDRKMLSLMISGQRLGRNVVPVIESVSEFDELRSLSAESSFVPQFGVRARLSAAGSGRWSASSGVHSKFGLSMREILNVLDELAALGLQDRLCMLHCHIGSQIADIEALELATREVAQVYADLVKRGFAIRYLDLGGGLGVNYTVAQTAESSINYSLREYANTIVGIVGEVCESHGVRCPILVTESGRALTAHHSVLIVPVLDVRARDRDTNTTIADDASEPLHALHKVFESLETEPHDPARLKAAWHAANGRMREIGTLFSLGYSSLEERAAAEGLFWQVCSRLLTAFSAIGEEESHEVAELEALLTDQYLCDFSVFQSMLDHWAIGQTFPIMPIARLDERPTRRGSIVDLTCDSDGKVSHYVSGNADSSFLPLHEVGGGEAYYIGFFLMGAYEDIVGDAHNLFGRVSEAHVYADAEEPEKFWIEKILPGTAVQEILAQMQYSPNDLHRRMSELVRERIRDGTVRPKQGIAILDQYMAGFPKSTYCDPRGGAEEAPE